MGKIFAGLFLIFLAACSKSGDGGGAGGSTTTTTSTGDTTAPLVSSTNPLSGATSIATNASISITFSEAMQTASITVSGTTACTGTIQLATSNTFATCVALNAPVVSNGNSTFTVTPISNLTGSTGYYLKITTAAKDTAGNALSAVYPSSFATVYFTTGAGADSTNPTPGTAISFASVGVSSLTVNWGAASDNVTAAASLEYKLVKDNSAAANIDTVSEVDAKTGGDLLLDWTANTLTKNVTGLTAGTTYYFAVIVRDAAGNKAIYTPGSQATDTNLFPRYAYDTTGKSVFIVYTTNATNPNKTNGTSISAAFDVFNDPERRWKASIPSGSGVRFVFYVSSDGTLANAYGRSAATTGYQTTWTETDGDYFTHANTQAYAHFNYDTTGKTVYFVYTTNATNPSKSNGTSITGSFDYYDGSTWRRFRGNIPSGASVRYVIYISNDTLANGYGRISSDGYQTTWTEADSYLALPQ